MNKKTTGILIIVAIVALGAGTFLVLRNNRKRYAKIIVDNNASQQPLAWIASLEEGYLKAWAAALKAGGTTFFYNGKTYNSQGGTAKK